MKALVLTAPRSFEYSDVPDPRVGSKDVLIKVGACGICGSDVHGMDGSTGRRIPPIIMGHEASGEIVAVGRDVWGWEKGDRVTFDSTVYCGECLFCRRGQVNLCDKRRVLGVSCDDYRQDGAFAEYVAVPERILYHLPDSLSFERAAMVEGLAVAVHAVGRSGMKLNDTVVVVGAGMIGLLVIQALRAAGAGRIVALDLDDGRLELARNLGANYAFRSDASDPIEEIKEITEGRGADSAFEVVGISPTLTLATNSLRKGGSLTLVGNVSPKTDLLLQAVVTRELTLYGSCASSGEYPTCLDLIDRGVVNVDPMISAVAPLTDGPGYFERLYSNEPGLMKVMLRPD